MKIYRVYLNIKKKYIKEHSEKMMESNFLENITYICRVHNLQIYLCTIIIKRSMHNT